MELSDFSKTDTAVRLRAAAANGALSHALIFSGSGDRAAAARYTADPLRVLYLTDSHDTRFDAYSVLHPMEEAAP